ncbi:MAG: hypothetical protein HC875_36535 [Anaerolineales bacterium]|nr:hypothetical protein [Anaerolineales bacterium]
MKQLDSATLERVHQAGAQDLEYRAAVRGREGALIQAQAWSLGGKSAGWPWLYAIPPRNMSSSSSLKAITAAALTP